MMDDVMRQRRNEPMIIIDIAVPRDVEPEVGKCYNCYLYDIDALKTIVDKHVSFRQEGRTRPGHHHVEVERFARWAGSLDAQATIRDLFLLMDEYIASEMRANSLEPGQAAIVEQKLRSSLKRYLHRVASYLKEHPTLTNIEQTRRIFQLDEDYQDRHKG